MNSAIDRKQWRLPGSACQLPDHGNQRPQTKPFCVVKHILPCHIFLLGYFAKLYYCSLNIAMFLKKASPFHFPYFIIYDFVGNRCGRFLAEIIILCLCVKNENLKVDSTDGKGMIAADTLLFVLPATCSCFLLFADDLVELLQQKVSNTFPTKLPVPRSGGHCLLQSGRLGLFTDASNTKQELLGTHDDCSVGLLFYLFLRHSYIFKGRSSPVS